RAGEEISRAGRAPRVVPQGHEQGATREDQEGLRVSVRQRRRDGEVAALGCGSLRDRHGMNGVKEKFDRVGNALVRAFQIVALFVIGGTIVWSATGDYLKMIAAGRARPGGIFLLFIYLQLGPLL